MPFDRILGIPSDYISIYLQTSFCVYTKNFITGLIAIEHVNGINIAEI